MPHGCFRVGLHELSNALLGIRLEHCNLRQSVQNGPLLRPEGDDWRRLAIVSLDVSSYTILACHIYRSLQDGDHDGRQA